MLLFRRQGAHGPRVFTVSSVLGPAEAQGCQVRPRLTLPLASPFRSFRQAPSARPATAAIEQSRHCDPHERSLPQRVRRRGKSPLPALRVLTFLLSSCFGASTVGS